jgi:hypothetical protein
MLQPCLLVQDISLAFFPSAHFIQTEAAHQRLTSAIFFLCTDKHPEQPRSQLP